MAQQMKIYMNEQPECWKKILTSSLPLTPEACQLLRRPFSHLLLFGSGSSYFAGQIARSFLETYCGIQTTVLTPSELEKQSGFFSPETTLALALSQSGKSVTTLEGMDALQRGGFSILALTADAESEIAKKAQGHLRISCGPETVGPKTKGMTATVLTLYRLGLDQFSSFSAAQKKEILSHLEQAAAAGEENLRLSQEFFLSHEKFFTDPNVLFVIADEEAYPACQEGALKLLETLYLPVQTAEMEEYTHGLQNTIQPGLHQILVVSGEKQASRMARLNHYQTEKGCVNIVLSSVPEFSGENVLSLAHTGFEYTVFMEILPAFHVFSALGSEARGINCDRPKFHDFYHVMDTKLNS